MSRSRQTQNSFRSGVLSPEIMGLSDNELYVNGLQIGRNITVQTVGGITRRAGTLFINDYGDVDYVRLFTFQFNRDQKYLIAMVVVNATTTKIDIYRDNVLVASDIAVPYSTKEELDALDFAQSADAMIFTSDKYPIQYLRRLGSDTTWDFIPVPLTNQPQYDPLNTGVPDTNMWSDALGYPQHCTFHQGRLWFAGSRTFPQNVWASMDQGFFDFSLGASDPADSIQEALDTDFINPITGIMSARQLQVFTRGAEFTNPATVMTPTTSYWVKQSNYGSEYDVAGVSVDGSTLFVDSSGRTIRSFTFAESRGGYDAPSVSSASEHLIKIPKRLGVLRGGELEPANFVYVVNSDGSMAVLNLSKAHGTLAWVEWTTQGLYKDVVAVDDEAYVLVQRISQSASEFVTHNGETVTLNGEAVWFPESAAPLEFKERWMLERIDDTMLVDSGNKVSNFDTTGVFRKGSDSDTFFGVYANAYGAGYVVIVSNGVIIYQTEDLRDDPTRAYTSRTDVRYSAGSVFSYNEEIRELYFNRELGFQWYMYALIESDLLNTGQNYIGNLTHLVGMEVVSNLDGNIEAPQIVVDGTTVSTVLRTHPDGAAWLFDNLNKITDIYANASLSESSFLYSSIVHTNPPQTDYGYLIDGVEGVAGSRYLQKGIVKTTLTQTFKFTGSASSSGVNLETLGDTWKITFDPNGEEITAGDELTVDRLTGLQDGLVISTTERPQFDVSLPFPYKREYGILINDNKLTAHFFHEIDGQLLGPTIVTGEVTYDPMTNKFSGDSSAYTTNPTTHRLSLSTPNGNLYMRVEGDLVQQGPVSVRYVNGLEIGATVITNESEIRLMELVQSTVVEGVALYPETPFIKGQAGLFIPVIAQTMPLNVSAGAGSLVNEPKRIVSVTTRYKDTQGVLVNGVSIPERKFGEDVLDGPPPLLTGIEKNRHLGYNRETSVTIIQNDPMPFTLLSIDIEINY